MAENSQATGGCSISRQLHAMIGASTTGCSASAPLIPLAAAPGRFVGWRSRCDCPRHNVVWPWPPVRDFKILCMAQSPHRNSYTGTGPEIQPRPAPGPLISKSKVFIWSRLKFNRTNTLRPKYGRWEGYPAQALSRKPAGAQVSDEPQPGCPPPTSWKI